LAETRGTIDDLERELLRIDRRGYKAYRDVEGAWQGRRVALELEHAQGDPFATPSRVRVRLAPEVHGIPAELWSNAPRRDALCDFVLRALAAVTHTFPRPVGTGNSSRVFVDAGDAEILPRSGCAIGEHGLELRFRVGLPARGRSVMGRAAAQLLTQVLPRAAEQLAWERLDQERARRWVEVAEDHAHVQGLLVERGLVAFVRDGSILPRASGISTRPLPGAVPFRSPDSLRVSLPTLHHDEIEGMGLREGVTLITGGGFHGKTTLLEALQYGIYPHVPGDGREWVVTRRETVKVRSEDGRNVAGVDLRPFIHDLPGAQDTARFTTADASGSTSLAAAILESLELGAVALLLDEDTSATNLLIRDARMQALVEKETITPLIDRVRELYEEAGVSTILVVGGSGDYLDVADEVILMEDYLPRTVIEQARAVAAERPTGRAIGDPAHPLRVTPRRPLPGSFDARRGRRERIRARGLRELVFGDDTIDLGALEQLVDDSQVRAIGALLKRLGPAAQRGESLRAAVETLLSGVERAGLGRIDPSPELALPRGFELAAAVNRLRGLEVEQLPDDGGEPGG
jgi:predicted ABC-class ATPase